MAHTNTRQTNRMGRNPHTAFATFPLGVIPNWEANRPKGRNRLIEPKEMISPRGRAPIKVIKNSSRVTRKPLFNAAKTV